MIKKNPLKFQHCIAHLKSFELNPKIKVIYHCLANLFSIEQKKYIALFFLQDFFSSATNFGRKRKASLESHICL